MKKFSEIRKKGTPKGNEQGKLPDPPPMLLLRRKAIRTFPNGQRVALYRNDKLELDVSVPYFPGKFGEKNKEVSYATEEFKLNNLDESIIKRLETIATSSQNGDVNFENGASVPVPPVLAKKILDLYKHEELSAENRQGLSKFVSGNPKDFKKIVDFVVSEQ
jgi:hypothetical protein